MELDIAGHGVRHSRRDNTCTSEDFAVLVCTIPLSECVFGLTAHRTPIANFLSRGRSLHAVFYIRCVRREKRVEHTVRVSLSGCLFGQMVPCTL